MDDKPKIASKKRTRRTPTGTSTGQSQSLTRGLQLLECVADARHGVSLTDLAQRAGLAASTTHRLLNTLKAARFVQQDATFGLWSVGVKAFSVGNAFVENRDFIAIARPFMRALMEKTGETINLAVLDMGEAVFLTQVECREMMRMSVKLGGRAPLHASAVGKVLLATMNDTEVATILHQRGLPRFTDNTITSPKQLRSVLAEVRRLGYSVDDEEHAVGLCCVAAALYDHHGEILAAISLSGPKARILDARIAELGAVVARSAGKITTALGGQRLSSPMANRG